MTLIDDIVCSHSVSVVGLEKNTGKTECLNYIIRNLPVERLKVAVTSIGVDGEGVDVVKGTHKPEIMIREGMFFSTSEKHYRQKKILSDLLDISNEQTALGRVVTARAVDNGHILLSGPSSASGLKRWMASLKRFDIDLAIVDGAISRLSSASPSISEAMVLATGAAYSANIPELIRKTAHVVDLIMLPLETHLAAELENVDYGIWRIEDKDITRIEGADSALSLATMKGNIVSGADAIYVSGALTDRFVDRIIADGAKGGFRIIVRDFTKIFISPVKYRTLKTSGVEIRVLSRSRLLAVCANPVSPNGIVLDSDRLCSELAAVLPVPVYDLFKI